MKKQLFTLLMVSLLIFSCSDNRTAEQMFQAGNELYAQDKVNRTIKIYDKLSNTYPDDPLAVKALYRVAEIYASDMQDFEKCVEKFNYISNEYPSHPDAPKARFMAGYTLANIMIDLERAKVEYEQFLRDYPEHSLAESVEFELRNLGKSLDEIDELKGIMKSNDE
ncbi:MAG: tetratricopeptide repeat protein [Candidatus Neomarinimicrobiota bacterium]